MEERIVEFINTLRQNRINISISESLDCFRALQIIPFEDKISFKTALSSTLIKDPADIAIFEEIFNQFFGLEKTPGHEIQPEQFIDDIIKALKELDESLLYQVSQLVIDSLGEIGKNDDYQELFERLKILVDSEIKRRLLSEQDRERVKTIVKRPQLEEINLASASYTQLAEIKKLTFLLARKLATRLAMKKKRAKRGRLDMRNTIRHSLSSGGVPLDTKYRYAKPSKPELFLLCDISGSVRNFSLFTLQFVYSLQNQFNKVRSFVFIDALDEVTKYLENEDLKTAISRIHREAEAVWQDGHSDYGHCLLEFKDNFLENLTSKSTVIILGDARNNYHQPQHQILEMMKRRTKRTIWLNPEYRDLWDSGDSIISDYSPYCDAVYECRNLKQLSQIIKDLV